MKICPKCKKGYDDSWSVCLSCSEPLEDDIESRLAKLEETAKNILTEIDAIRKGGKTTLTQAAQEEKREVRQASTIDKEDTETRIGKYFLNKIGIISVVAGVAFFLAYAFKYLSPLFRVGTGYFVSILMIASGIMIAKAEKYKWYGRSVLCGGWILAYFTTFAMYHIKATRIISNQLMDIALVSLVVAGMAIHLYKYRSQSLVILALFLGYTTAGISQYASFSLGYITVLTVVASVFLVRMNWQLVAASALLGTYVTHFLWVRPFGHAQIAPSDFWISTGFLAAYWMIYNAAGLFFNAEEQKDKNGQSAFILANSMLFGLVAYLQVSFYNGAWKTPFALSAAGILLLAAAISRFSKRANAGTAYIVSAIAFITVSFRFFAGKGEAYFLWFAEIPALLLAGLYMNNGLYRLAAWGLSLAAACGMLVYFGVPRETVRFMGRELPLTLFLYLAGAASFYLARFAYAAKPASTDLEKNESWLSNAYTITAGIVILCVSFYEVQTRLVTLTWAVSALLLFAVGFFLKDKIFRYSAIGVVLISLLRGIFVDLAGVNTFYRIIVFICLGVVLMAVSFWYAKIPAEGKAQGPSGGVEAKTVSVMSVVLIALFVLAGAFFYPSDHRKEDKELSREVAVTARFIAGNELDGEEALFLRGRKFRRLEQMLLSRDLRNEDDPDIYFRAMDLGLESRSVYSKLASYYIGRKEKTKALNMYEKGIALDPGIKEWDTRYMLRSAAALYKETENYKKAAEYYEKYLKFYKNATDLYELAVCYEHTGELDKALEKLTEALNADRGGQYSSEINTLRSDIYSKKAMFEEKEKAQPAEGAK